MRLTCSLEAPQPLGSALVRPLLVPLQPGAMAALQICALALPTRLKQESSCSADGRVRTTSRVSKERRQRARREIASRSLKSSFNGLMKRSSRHARMPGQRPHPLCTACRMCKMGGAAHIQRNTTFGWQSLTRRTRRTTPCTLCCARQREPASIDLHRRAHIELLEWRHAAAIASLCRTHVAGAYQIPTRL